MDAMDLGQGVAQASIRLPRGLFYTTLSQRSGLSVSDDGDLMELLTELAEVRKAYDKVAPALIAARETGYGIVLPTVEELELEDPEIVRQGGRYGHPHAGQRAVHPHDPGGCFHHRVAYRGQRKAVGGDGQLPAPAVRGRHR